MKYLLDTCVLSDFINGDPGTLKKLKSLNPSLICLSTLTVFEIYYGLSRYTDKVPQFKLVLESFLKGVTIVPFEWEDAEAAAKIKVLLSKTGKEISSYDILMAGIAKRRGFILVTSNTSSFENILALKIENWR